MSGVVWKHWNWLDIVAIPFTAALMRVAWISPYVALLTSPPISGRSDVHVPVLLLLAFSFGGAILAYLASESREGLLIAAITGLSACLTVLWVAFSPHGEGLGALFGQLLHWNNTLPAPVVLLAATALLWWRGMATQGMDHAALARAFTTGAMMMAILLVVARVFPRFISTGQLVAAFTVFLTAGLATLALKGASQALQRSQVETGAAIELSNNWLFAVLGVIGVIVFVGWLVSLIIAPQTVLEVLAWLRPLWQLLGRIVYYILLPFVYLIFMILMPLIRWFMSLYNQSRPEEGAPTPMPTPEPLEEFERATKQIPPALDFFLRAILIVGIVLLFIWLLALTLRRRGVSRRRVGVLESRESLWSWDLMRAQLASLFNRPHPEPPPPLFYPLRGDLADPRLIIRAAYRRLLSLALERGYPRARRQTPDTYRERLDEMAPTQGAELHALTEVYTTARYAADALSQAQAEKAQQAVERIETALGASDESQRKENKTQSYAR